MKPSIQIGLILSFVSQAFAGPKLAKDLPPGNTSALVSVVVQFKTPPTKDELQQLGAYGQLKKIFNSINAVIATVSLSLLAALEADPNVKYISPNRTQTFFFDDTAAT